jgi:N-acyl-D-aspartate/D-glutamate deacylase
VLGECVRERGIMTLEKGVQRLTAEIADFLELPTRGRIRAGNAADLVLFDPDRINPQPPEWLEDLPGRQPRLIERAVGIDYTIVGGHVLFAANEYQGGMPGRVLRGAGA